MSRGAQYGLWLGVACTNNTFNLGTFGIAAIKDVFIDDSGSANNTFIGGKINSLTDNGSGNRWYGVQGGEVYGQYSGTVAGGIGQDDIPHGLKGVPVYAEVGLLGDATNSVEVSAVDDTTITVRVYVTATGANTADAVDVTIIFRANL
jgi:hypothetical protein